MPKDKICGLNSNGTETVSPVTIRSVQPGAHTSISSQPAYDLDSACIECRNPSVWNTEHPRELIFHGISQETISMRKQRESPTCERKDAQTSRGPDSALHGGARVRRENGSRPGLFLEPCPYFMRDTR